MVRLEVRRLPALLVVAALGYGGAALGQSEAAASEEDEDLEEVVVTGTYIKRTNQANVASPLDTVGLEDIEASGWTDLEDVAETFTFNTSSWGRSGLRSGCCGTARGIEVRGLGSSSTLVLQNGKRVASVSTGANGADLTNIKALMPVIAIDRIETLLDGGAALYGSDAVAGVVNIIPRTDFEGFEMRAGGKQIDGSGQWETQFILGGGNDRVHGIFALGFEHVDHLLNRERPFRLLNNTSGNGTPGSYNLEGRPVGDNGEDVVIDNGFHGAINYSDLWDQGLISSSIRIADPYCRPGIVPDYPGGYGSFTGEKNVTVPGGGQYSQSGDFGFPIGSCRFTYQPHNSITPQEDTALVYSHWNVAITESMDLSLEYSSARRNSWTEFIATFPMTNGKPVVPAHSPFNPYGVDAVWTGRPMGLAYPPVRTRGEGVSERYAMTLTGDFAAFAGADFLASWTYSLSAQWSQDYGDGEAPDTDLRLVQYALDGYGGPNCEIRFDGPGPSAMAGTGNCFYFSPFGANIYRDTFNPDSGYGSVGQVDADGNLVLASAEDTKAVLDYSIQTESKSYSERSLRVLEGVVTGDLFQLPGDGGMVGLALGWQSRHQRRDVFITNFRQGFWQGFLDPSIGGEGGRSVDAFFLETFLPFSDRLDAQIAVRRESYDPGLSSTDPKVGVRWQILEPLTLRASWGTSFRAASIGQVIGTDTDAFVAEIRDPIDPVEFNTGTGTFRTILVSKNPTLEPEESENFNIGMSWTPELPWGDDSHDFQLDLDWYQFQFQNQIRSEDANAVVAADPCGSQVVRDPINFITNPLLGNDPAGNCSGNLGSVLVVNIGFFNAGQTEVKGLDLGARYSFDLGANQITVRSETSYINQYDVQVTADGDVIEGAGWTNDGNPGSPIPEIRSNLFLTWVRDIHSANVTLRYIHSMKDDIFGIRPPVAEIDASTEVDVQYQVLFGEDRQYSATIGAINLFDREPPFHAFEGYVTRVHNPYMRQIYGRLSFSL